jgi:hypothetical protein
MVAPNDVWAVGYSLAGGIVVLHYHGTGWTQVASPGGAGALAVLSANDIYGVGGNITHWDGSSWTVVDTLINYPWPALGAATVLPNGEIWAAGRTVDSNNIFETLVYRSSTSSPPPPMSVCAQAESALKIGAWPNPFSQTIQLGITAQKPQLGEVVLSDVTGRKLMSKTLSIVEGSHTTVLDVPAGLHPGVYTLELRMGRQRRQISMVKN